MDILNAIKEKVDIIRKRSDKIDLSDLLLHLERAEFYFQQGRESQDDNYFTDVIYRTNQAFEGGLREVYNVQAKKGRRNIKTHEIEKYLLDNNILKSRVLDFFTHYRQNWRNESAHNYRLSFNESEALMAIMTVSSFSYVLINQILETLAFQIESTIDIDKKELERIIADKDTEIDEKIVSLIKLFYSQNSDLIKKENYSELEIIGLFTGFLNTTTKGLKIQQEVKLDLKRDFLRPDLVFELGGEKVIMEFKRNRIKKNIDTSRTQMIKYLFSTEIKNGVIFYFNKDDHKELKVEKNILTDYDLTFTIMEIY